LYNNLYIKALRNLLFDVAKAWVLQGKSGSFDVQKSRFRNAKSKLVFSCRIIFTKSRRFLGFVIEFLGILVFLDFLDFIDELAVFLVLGA